MQSAKQAAREAIDHLPDQALWDDIIYQLHVKQKIAEGLADIEAGRTIPHAQLKAELLHDGEVVKTRLARHSQPKEVHRQRFAG